MWWCALERLSCASCHWSLLSKWWGRYLGNKSWFLNFFMFVMKITVAKLAPTFGMDCLFCALVSLRDILGLGVVMPWLKSRSVRLTCLGLEFRVFVVVLLFIIVLMFMVLAVMMCVVCFLLHSCSSSSVMWLLVVTSTLMIGVGVLWLTSAAGATSLVSSLVASLIPLATSSRMIAAAVSLLVIIVVLIIWSSLRFHQWKMLF